MKKIFFVFAFSLLFLSFSDTFAQYDRNWALGFRVGEPLGINVRKYLNGGDNAFDLNIGTYGFLYNTTVGYNNGYYLNSGLAIQGHYLWNRELFGKDYIHWYYGFGGQINNRKYYDASKTDLGARLSMGGSGTTGLEFKLPASPLAIFVDGGLYVELLPVPFHFNPEISAGLRLNMIR